VIDVTADVVPFGLTIEWPEEPLAGDNGSGSNVDSTGQVTDMTTKAPMIRHGWRRPARTRAVWVSGLAGILLMAPLAASAQTPDAPLTLAEAARSALESYPSVGSSDARLRAARSAVAVSSAAHWPSLQLDASATRFQDPMLVTPLHAFDPQAAPAFEETLVQGSLTARYTLWDGGERGARIDRSRAGVESAAAALDAAHADVIWQVTQQYALALAAHDALVAHEQRVSALEEEVDRARQLFDVGRAPELQVLRARAASAQATAERTRSETQLDVALHELSRLVGGSEALVVADLVPVRVTDPAIPARQELLEQAYAHNPDIRRMQGEVQAASAGVKLARGAFFPDLQLVGQYDNRGSTEGSFFGEWAVGAAVSFPLFQGGARINELERARAERESAERQLDLTQLRAAERVDRALGALREAEARSASLRSAVEQYAEVARAEKLALDTGAGTQTDYLTAHADLLSARAQLAETAMNRIIAWAELARVTGQLSLGWVRDNLENE
jgi:outer membrane protein